MIKDLNIKNEYLREEFFDKIKKFLAEQPQIKQNFVIANEVANLTAQNFELSRQNLEFSQLLNSVLQENRELKRRVTVLLERNEAVLSDILGLAGKRTRK